MAGRDLHITLHDHAGAAEITPDAVPLTLLKQFADEVGRFLSGSQHEVDLASLPMAIVKGSLELVAKGLPESLGLWTDLAQLDQQDRLHAIDPVRAEVMDRWQAVARKRTTRSYTIAGANTGDIVVSSASAFRASRPSRWAAAERYVRGFLYDAGGKESPNIRLQLADGRSLPIRATREQLRDEKENRLYREVLVRVEVQQNVDTGDWHDARLIRFEDYHPAFDPDAFAAFVEEGGKAWHDVTDPVAWVREQRGG